MLNPEQRRWRADKLADLANLAAGALIFGQFIAGSFQLDTALLGLVIVLCIYTYSHFLLKRIN